MVASSPRLVTPAWHEGYRVVSSREAPVAALSALIDDPADLEELVALEAMTNPIARVAREGVANIPPSERIIGPGAALIMTPFVIPTISRFSDGTYGVFYAGDALETAAAERAYHVGLGLRASHEKDIVLRAEGYAYTVSIAAPLHDARRAAIPPPPSEIYDPAEYGAGQRYGGALRQSGSNGILYDSVRRGGAECAGFFRPRCVADPRPAGIVYFDWDGVRVTFSKAG